MSGAARRVILFGDSHVHAIQEALRIREQKGRPVALEPHRLLKTKGGPGPQKSRPPDRSLGGRFTAFWRSLRTRRTAEQSGEVVGDTSFEDFLRIAAKLKPSDVLVSVIGGNQHAVFSTILHPQPFDFFQPATGADEVDDSATLIPYRALYDYFAGSLRAGDGTTIAALREATPAKLVHLLAPPPKRENAFIEQNHDTRFAAERISDHGVSSPELRMKFWHLQNRALAEICAELAVETIPPPPETCDEDGFLDRRFYAGDATHANHLYGERVVEDLERRFL